MTSAFVVRDRLPDEPARSRKIVELEAEACYNAQRYLLRAAHETDRASEDAVTRP